MKTAETNKESLVTSDVTLPYHKKYEVTDLVTIPTFDPKYAVEQVDEEEKQLNFSQGMGAFVLDKIVLNSDMMASRERIKANAEEGLTYKERLKMMKGFTAGQVFKAKGCRIGKDINDIHKENSADARLERIESTRKERDAYAVLQSEAAAVSSLNIKPKKDD
jgi:hypothetical protein